MGTNNLRINHRLANVAITACLSLSLAACGSTGHGQLGAGGSYKIGKPYQVGGVWYYPHEDENYDATGIGSWYGPQFHGMHTANGEVFDQDAITAAHPTLPMPVLVRVTNLENGRSLIVRVNDRGPFVAGREIDVSRRAAEILGFDRKGTAKVRVQFVSRAPLPGSPGLGEVRYAGSVGETFVAPKAEMEEDEKVVTAAPVATGPEAVTTTALAPPAGVATEPAPVTAPLPAPIMITPIETVQAPPAATEPIVQHVPVPAATGIYIQVGAFQNIQNAEMVKRQLVAYGNVQISKTVVGGTPYYRVRVGPLSDVPTADASLKRVVQDGHTGARIVVE